MKSFRFVEIDELVKRFDYLPDAQFVSMLAQNGVDASEIAAYAKEKEKFERQLKAARRK